MSIDRQLSQADFRRLFELFTAEAGAVFDGIDLEFAYDRSYRLQTGPKGASREGFYIEPIKSGRLSPPDLPASAVSAGFKIGCRSGAGFLFALETLSRRLSAQKEAGERHCSETGNPGFDLYSSAPEFPAFEIRGIIEGYYGPPWSRDARRRMICSLPGLRMNSYFYGPKDDRYHRERWAELYPDGELDELRELSDLCSAQDSMFWYGIGPGLSIRYSSASDEEALYTKLMQLVSAGIRCFGLYFDDIPPRLMHDEDKARWNTLGDAHADFTMRIYRRLKASCGALRLAVCPTEYWGEPSAYLTALSEGLDPAVMIFHTGPEICSRVLSLPDGFELAKAMGRPVLFWDNYPVNDLQMSHRLHIGPYLGRDRHLYRVSCGVAANGMEFPEASKIAIGTIADYLWNPEAYDPEESYRLTLRRCLGERDWADFLPFADNNRASCLYPNDGTVFRDNVDDILFRLRLGDKEGAKKILDAEIERLNRSQQLFSRGMENRELEAEIRPWTAQFGRGLGFLRALSAYLGGPETGVNELIKSRTAFLSHPQYVFSDVMSALIGEAGRLLDIDYTEE